MAASNHRPRISLQFNDFDFRHRKVLEILRARPRNMTDMVVNAILHFISCPDAEQEYNKESMKKIIREVILSKFEDTQKEGGLRIEVRPSSRYLLFAIYPPIISIELIGTGQPAFINCPVLHLIYFLRVAPAGLPHSPLCPHSAAWV